MANLNKGKPRMPDIETLISMGLMSENDRESLKPNILTQLRILDEQNAINRFKWYNLPKGLTSEIIETVLYYRGNGAFFYLESEDRFYFLPYTLNGTIDVYGRYTGLTPMPFTGRSETDKGVFIPGLILKPQYDVLLPEEIDYEKFTESAVIVNDYCKQYSQKVIPRQQIQEGLLNMMSDCLPLAMTSLVANSGIKAIQVKDPSQGWIVKAASDAIYDAALKGTPWIPICTDVDTTDILGGGSPLKSEEYLLTLQGLDNYRLSLYGLKNGGLFQKKAHMLEAEQEMNNGNVGLVLQDCLTYRQRAADIANSIWGTSIYVEPSECVLGIDRNQDMMIGDDTTMETMPQTEEGATEEVEDD